MNRKLAALAALAAAVFVGCAGETDPATNVSPTGATLNGKGDCDANDGRIEWWYEISREGGAFTRVGPRNVVESGCETDGKVMIPGLDVSGLTPSTQHRFRLAMDSADPDQDANGWVDANGTIGGTAYDSFTTLDEPTPGLPPIPKRVVMNFDGSYSPGHLNQSGSSWSNTFASGYLRMAQTASMGGGFNRAQVPNADWAQGDDVWYGGEFRLEGPASNYRYTTFVAGDDYPNARLGVVIEDGEGVLITTRYGGTPRELGRFALPLGVDFTLDVHQVLQPGTGAVNEVYIDGQRVVSNTIPNLLDANQQVNYMRFGYVSQSASSTPGAMRLLEAYVTEQP